MSAEKEEVRQLREELKRTRELVFQMAKLAEMGKLVAVVAHELSQPLLGIKAFAQILRRRLRNDGFVEPKIRMIEEQAVHMENILEGLRRHSKKPFSGKKDVDPIEPVKAAVELFMERAKKQRTRLTLEAPKKLPKVRLSHGLLQQVVVNLLSNALDELEEPKGGQVLVRLEPLESGVRIRVADTGKGIPAAVRQRLFEPFYTTKGSEKGTGLGLSICRDILHDHRGEIRLMDPSEVEQVFESGFGAVFEVSLAGVAKKHEEDDLGSG